MLYGADPVLAAGDHGQREMPDIEADNRLLQAVGHATHSETGAAASCNG